VGKCSGPNNIALVHSPEGLRNGDLRTSKVGNEISINVLIPRFANSQTGCIHTIQIALPAELELLALQFETGK